jgi:hypothetical protein
VLRCATTSWCTTTKRTIRSLEPAWTLLAAVDLRGVIVTPGPGLRLRIAVLRAQAGHRRGPGDRVGPLRPHPLLVGTLGKDRNCMPCRCPNGGRDLLQGQGGAGHHLGPAVTYLKGAIVAG